MGFGKEKSKSSQTSKPLNADEVASYYQKLNELSSGRLNTFATEGTPATTYNSLTPDEIRAVGGMGATRRLDLGTERDRMMAETAADPSLSVFQRQRSKQLYNQDYQSRLDAINKETEAAIASLLSDQRAKEYSSNVANAELDRLDLEALASIFFGGKGQAASTNQSSSGFKFSL